MVGFGLIPADTGDLSKCNNSTQDSCESQAFQFANTSLVQTIRMSGPSLFLTTPLIQPVRHRRSSCLNSATNCSIRTLLT